MSSNYLEINILAETRLPTLFGPFRIFVFSEQGANNEHIALVKDPLASTPTVRVHSECLTGDVLSSLRCDCGFQLISSLQKVSDSRSGVVIYLRQEGRGIGLTSKLRAYNLQDSGLNTAEANLALGMPVDSRSFAPAFAFLRAMGVRSMRLITNNPDKLSAARRFGIEVVERLEVPSPLSVENGAYLKAKRDVMGHSFQADPVPLVKFAAPTIAVGDLRESVEWYTNVFGMMCLNQSADNATSAHLVLGHFHLVLKQEVPSGLASARSNRTSNSGLPVSFFVENLSAFLAHCRGLRVRIVMESQRTENEYVAIISDPTDNELFLKQQTLNAPP